MINKHFKIFDCFTFYNEIEMLHVRLEELYDFVDYFILCEAPLTFRGKTKNLFYEENKKMFEKYNDKIIHIVDNEIPKNIDDTWQREFHQRDYLNEGLKKFNLNKNDQIIISDIDEIPSVKKLKKILPVNWVYSLEQEFYYYNLNNKLSKKWRASKILNYQTYVDKFDRSPQKVRSVHDYRKIFNLKINRNIIKNCGWHFSYFGGVDNIINKIQSISHFENDTNDFKNREHIANSINRGEDIFDTKEFKINKIKKINVKKLPKGIEHLINL